MSRKDSRIRSVCEIAFDTLIAATIATTLNYLILPHYIDTIQSGEFFGMVSISIWYVVASLVRKYFIRRWFVNMKRNTTPAQAVYSTLVNLKDRIVAF